MQIIAAIVSAALLVQQGLAAAEPQQAYGYAKPPACPADKCFSSIRLRPTAAKIASSVCSKYISRTDKTTTSTKTTTVTISSTTKIDQTQAQVTATATQTTNPPAITVSPTCTTTTTTVEGQFATVTNFRVRGVDPGTPNVKRAQPVVVPDMLGKGCGSGRSYTSKLSSACSCLLGTRKTKTSTKTSTVTATVVATSTSTLPADTITVTATTAADASTVTSCQTATATTTNFPGGSGLTCGLPIAAYTRASFTCTNAAPAQETNARFRIEGGSEGNVFDGCIASGPENITTPSGGTHLCDGTNNNANPLPGGTLTTQIDAAGRQEGFGLDGTYSNQFQDFFINSISATTSTGSQFWGVLRNKVFTARGGCQEQISNGDEGLWAFDAFAANRVFLNIAPDVVVAEPGSQVTVTITAVNPNNGAGSPVAGASLGTGSVSDANGNIVFTVPDTPGCYLFKAEATNAIRSQTLYLSSVAGL